MMQKLQFIKYYNKYCRVCILSKLLNVIILFDMIQGQGENACREAVIKWTGLSLQGSLSDYAPLERPKIPAIVVSHGFDVNRVMGVHFNLWAQGLCVT